MINIDWEDYSKNPNDYIGHFSCLYCGKCIPIKSKIFFTISGTCDECIANGKYEEQITLHNIDFSKIDFEKLKERIKINIKEMFEKNKGDK